MGISATWTDPNSLDLVTNQVLTQTIWEEALGNLLLVGGTAGPVAATFTPTMTQSGAITLSVASGRAISVGKLVLATINISINSSGSSGNNIIVGGISPVTSTSAGSAGFGYYTRSGGTTYAVTAQWVTSSTLQLWSGGVASPLGTTPAFAVGAGDTLGMTLLYERS